MTRLLDALHSGRVLVMDGAMGTELQRLGLRDDECSALWNLTHPEEVAAVHSAYVAAGVDVLVTNSFRANPIALAERGCEHQLAELWRAAIRNARDQGKPSTILLASIGPFEDLPLDGCITLLNYCRDADGVLLETWSPVDQLRLLAYANQARKGPHLPLLISFAYTCACTWPDRNDFPHTSNHWRAEDCAVFADEKLGATVIGTNCGVDIDLADMRYLVLRYHAFSNTPKFIRPNAGTPTRTATGWQYPRSPEEMADKLWPLLEAGVTMVGGCCGTTPAHIAAFRRVVDEWNAKRGHGA